MAGYLLRRLSILAIVAIVAGGIALAVTASVGVPTGTHTGEAHQTLTIAQMAPSASSSIAAGLTDIVLAPSGAGTTAGTTGNDLIIGSGSGQTLGTDTAGNGSDCCIGVSDTVFKASCVDHVP